MPSERRLKKDSMITRNVAMVRHAQLVGQNMGDQDHARINQVFGWSSEK